MKLPYFLRRSVRNKVTALVVATTLAALVVTAVALAVYNFRDYQQTKLAEIPGVVPSLKQRIEGCVFAGRCAQATELCRQVAPALELKAPGHLAACHYAPKEALAA